MAPGPRSAAAAAPAHLAEIERALPVLRQREPHQHADNGGRRHRQQHADEAEQRAAGKQREHDPDRMQVDAIADQLGRQKVAFDELTRREDGGDQGDRVQRVELRDGEAHADDEADQHAEIGNEGHQARGQPDDQPEVEPDERQADAVEQAEQQANGELPAKEAGQRLVDQTRLLADRRRMMRAAARNRPARRSGPSRATGRRRRPA